MLHHRYIIAWIEKKSFWNTYLGDSELDFNPNATQLHIHELARAFVVDCVEFEAEKWERSGTIPKAFLKRMAQLGFLGIVAPPEYGGSEIDPVGFVLALIEISAVSPTLGFVMSTNNQFIDTLVQLASKQQKERILPDHVAGGHIASIALTEIEARSNARVIRTVAKKIDGGYLLNGTKIYVFNGEYPGTMLVCARTSKERRRGLSFFLIDKAKDEIKREQMDSTLGFRSVSMTVNNFKDLFVSEEDRLGEEGSGLDIIQLAMESGQIGIAGQCAGIARAGLNLALGHAKQRKQLGDPLLDLQGTQFSLTDMATWADASESMVLQAAWMKAIEKNWASEAAMAEMYASEMAGRITDAALQIHCGAGYVESSPITKFYSDAPSAGIFEGTNEVKKLLIARSIIGELNRFGAELRGTHDRISGNSDYV